ncbi:MAG: hypothetical protein LBF87_08250 [Treponema sp.]|nr:hypothetical protein [Treponema sp.]
MTSQRCHPGSRPDAGVRPIEAVKAALAPYTLALTPRNAMPAQRHPISA